MVSCNPTLFIAALCNIPKVQDIQKVKKLKPALRYGNSLQYSISSQLLTDKSFLHHNYCLAVCLRKMWVIHSCS